MKTLLFVAVLFIFLIIINELYYHFVLSRNENEKLISFCPKCDGQNEYKKELTVCKNCNHKYR